MARSVLGGLAGMVLASSGMIAPLTEDERRAMRAEAKRGPYDIHKIGAKTRARMEKAKKG